MSKTERMAELVRRDVFDVEAAGATARPGEEFEGRIPEHDVGIDDPRSTGPPIRGGDGRAARRVAEQYEIDRVVARDGQGARTGVGEPERARLLLPHGCAGAHRRVGGVAGKIQVRRVDDEEGLRLRPAGSIQRERAWIPGPDRCDRHGGRHQGGDWPDRRQRHGGYRPRPAATSRRIRSSVRLLPGTRLAGSSFKSPWPRRCGTNFPRLFRLMKKVARSPGANDT